MTTNNGHALTAPELEGAVWTKSSHSGDSQGQCVEVADLTATRFAGMRAIRDSKNPNGPALLFSDTAVMGFLADVRDGRFDS
ncbi:DUF397 domain-containing protein [Streptomyces chartreusis]|uniref:DUF397 domain-containing protein n=1 Tax=Streptomyces chartreusis TaxID=1969 RepID=A0A7H8TA14_STRCX|nr:DUF397 domain-containing protein [Streptomyces chartreusis]QKZ20326.1 DUF397 domain-containing protein [Streptomyces chartreusis]